MFSFKKKDVPTQAELGWARKASEYTPDIAYLQRRRTQLLFVYDQLQKGHREYEELIESYSVPLGIAFTQESFALYKRRIGSESYAIALDDTPFKVPRAHIRGEIRAVVSDHYLQLDKYYENGIVFARRRVTLKLPYQTEAWSKEGGMHRSPVKYQNIRSWMYVGIPDYWNGVLDGEFFLFDTVRVFEPKNPELSSYYSFTKLEYEE